MALRGDLHAFFALRWHWNDVERRQFRGWGVAARGVVVLGGWWQMTNDNTRTILTANKRWDTQIVHDACNYCNWTILYTIVEVRKWQSKRNITLGIKCGFSKMGKFTSAKFTALRCIIADINNTTNSHIVLFCMGQTTINPTFTPPKPIYLIHYRREYAWPNKMYKRPLRGKIRLLPIYKRWKLRESVLWHIRAWCELEGWFSVWYVFTTWWESEFLSSPERI